ncbi:MAG: hypothetical protein QOH58_1266, partial [Thermoleophilaceae bacterium]|nr:hypothetical protein [Thermoleophilaceae bacterium]
PGGERRFDPDWVGSVAGGPEGALN